MFGLVGGIILIAIYAVIIIRIIYIARTSRKDYGAFICAGVAGMMIIQTVENIGMNLCMLPVIGITLPFMSAGGSSVLATYMMVGLAHSVSAHEKKFYFSAEV
jgi:rod shape determining protein RodA